MNLFKDHLLRIGKTHKICEDYIISGNDPIPYIIIADGCSSSEYTDVGARILCHTAKQYLGYYKNSIQKINEDCMGNFIILTSKETVKSLNLPITCLDATLIISYYYNKQIKTVIYGDGSIIYIDNYLKNIEIHTIEYSKNAPYYLSYNLDSDRKKIYHKNKINKMVHIYSKDLTMTMPENYDEPYTSTCKISSGQNKTVLICSDGISTFFNKEEFLPIEELIDDFSSFKTLKGEFLQRRLLSKRGAITKFKKDGYNHLDDLSIGAFVLEDD